MQRSRHDVDEQAGVEIVERVEARERGHTAGLELAGGARRGERDVYAEAGVPCARLARQCARWDLGPAEFFSGIPGTVGGALAMNAGAFGGETWNIVAAVETLDRHGERRDKPRDGVRGNRKGAPVRQLEPVEVVAAQVQRDLAVGEAGLGPPPQVEDDLDQRLAVGQCMDGLDDLGRDDEDRIAVTVDAGGAIEIRTFDLKTLKPTGRLRFATEP